MLISSTHPGFRCIASLLLGCLTGAPHLTANFTDVAREAGLYLDPLPMPETDPPADIDPFITGSPMCAVDIDNDSWTDLLVCPTPGRVRVFLNNRDGTFREEAESRGFEGMVDVSGIAAGDIDNDGDPDVFMVPRTGPQYFLFINDGTGNFEEQSTLRGADMTVAGEAHKGQSIAMVDFDEDGYLDVHVMEWGIAANSNSSSYTVLLRNRGRELPGFFINVTEAAGLTQPYFGTSINAFSSAWADFDKDGDPDLSLINDYGNSQFWENNGDGTFSEKRDIAGVGTDGNGMGVAVMDYNRDGWLDFFVSSFDDLPSGTLVSANRLYENQGDGTFKNKADQLGIENSSWGWGSVFFDPDNDMDLDAVVTNGYPYGHWPGRETPENYIEDARTDQTCFFENSGKRWSEAGGIYGINDNGFARSVLAFDYDKDGDEDLLIGTLQDTTGTYRPWILYRNDFDSGKNWLRLQFQGVYSNKDGYGTEVSLTAGGITQTAIYAPTNAYISQREPYLHFGMGNVKTAEKMVVTWPNGTRTEYINIAANQVVNIIEPLAVDVAAPKISTQPTGGSFNKDETVILAAHATGEPEPLYQWYKNGEPILGANHAELTFHRLLPSDAGEYSVIATNAAGDSHSINATISVTADVASKSIARWWNEALLDAIRIDTPNPPVHGRNLYHLSAALWDAFWAYEPNAWQTITPAFTREQVTLSPEAASRKAAQAEAMSFAAYRILQTRFQNSPGADQTKASIDWLMHELGYDPSLTGNGGDEPHAVGNRIAESILAATIDDGANERNGYVDATDYMALNEPMIVGIEGTEMLYPNNWQPLLLGVSITQNGILLPSGLQDFIGVNAKLTTPFAMAKPTYDTIALDPGPQPHLGGIGHEELVQEVIEIIRVAAMLDPADGVMIDVSPGAMLNNDLGTNNGSGHPLNPYTNQPYAPNFVPRADYGRILAEFWADGPESETPPGHWNVLFNEASDHPAATLRFEGKGEPLDRLEWDVRAYLALNGALHDAACAAWTVKRQYDSSRPISLIRYMGGLGQSSDASKPGYHANGLPLIDDLIELTTLASVSPGGKHANIVKGRELPENYVDKIVLKTWLGNPTSNPDLTGGVDWKLAEAWFPYQRNTFVTPAFPGYVSGHSTFSRAAAEVMTLLTGTSFFPGGLAVQEFEEGAHLEFEKGPSVDFELQWATYYDASDQAGLSRLYGGIHISSDDLIGRILGARVGIDAFNKAKAMGGK